MQTYTGRMPFTSRNKHPQSTKETSDKKRGTLSCSALPAAKKVLFHLTAKNNIAAGSELIAAELR